MGTYEETVNGVLRFHGLCCLNINFLGKIAWSICGLEYVLSGGWAVLVGGMDGNWLRKPFLDRILKKNHAKSHLYTYSDGVTEVGWIVGTGPHFTSSYKSFRQRSVMAVL
jgi:hypothetical protein